LDSLTQKIQIRVSLYIPETMFIALLGGFQGIRAVGLRVHHKVERFLEVPASVPVAAVVVVVQTVLSHASSPRLHNSPYLTDCVEGMDITVKALLEL
jgi:hypothetical protein